MSPKNITNKELKRKAAEKKEIDANNAKTSSQWWTVADTEMLLEGLGTAGVRTSVLPNGSGNMISFQEKLTIKLQDCRLMSAVDENNKLCVSLDDSQFECLQRVSDKLQKTLIARLKLLHPNHDKAEFVPSVKTSEQTGQNYLKTKVQLLGFSRSMGCGLDGVLSKNIPETLSTVGSGVDMRIRIDGVYLTKERCGIVTKVDIFKLKTMPSEEDVEAERAAKKQRMEESRTKELMNAF
jgi:hypothetical protein